MKTLYAKSAGQTIGIHTNSNFLIDFLLSEDNLKKTVIPGFHLIEEGKPQLNLVVDGKSNMECIKFDKLERTLLIEHKSSTNIPKYPLIYAISYVFNKVYQENGLYQLHGSAISNENSGIIILGHEDYGKSRIAMKLCLDYGFNFNGDEKVIINSQDGNVIEACSLIQISADKLNYYFPGGKISGLEINSERDKIILNSRDLWINKLPGPKIKNIFYGHVCPDVPRFVKVEEGDARRRFYENITESIRGQGYVLLDINSAYPSLDTEFISRKRVKFVKDFVDERKLSTYIVRDSLEGICNKINNLLKKND
jgi:hypothetical protein